ncbi:rhodanese-like domain-containing protein [Naumannella halotolerans]|uniref:Rhodanese-related sulfurtransferase n=1 Tax=Naumannella halotolerans TaxID=993414 RepID=A0A4R7IWR6_9ACTN|nr:rhodanese-like domain-containing protein [Naumannella halotolerans]TDT29111.1 rhodanese-related sulfurtransferase [Naumannella halotolerans]
MGEELPTTDPNGAEALVAEGYQLLDVRTQAEWDEAHVEGATHIPLDQLTERVGEVGPQVVAMCRSGGRSAQATAFLNHSGKEAVNLDGGILEWAAQGKPVVSG